MRKRMTCTFFPRKSTKNNNNLDVFNSLARCSPNSWPRAVVGFVVLVFCAWKNWRKFMLSTHINNTHKTSVLNWIEMMMGQCHHYYEIDTREPLETPAALRLNHNTYNSIRNCQYWIKDPAWDFSFVVRTIEATTHGDDQQQQQQRRTATRLMR